MRHLTIEETKILDEKLDGLHFLNEVYDDGTIYLENGEKIHEFYIHDKDTKKITPSHYIISYIFVGMMLNEKLAIFNNEEGKYIIPRFPPDGRISYLSSAKQFIGMMMKGYQKINVLKKYKFISGFQIEIIFYLFNILGGEWRYEDDPDIGLVLTNDPWSYRLDYVTGDCVSFMENDGYFKIANYKNH